MKMYRLFGGRNEKRGEQEKKTTNKLQSALDRLESRQRYLEKKVYDSEQNALRFLRGGDRCAALREVKRKRMFQEQCYQLATQI